MKAAQAATDTLQLVTALPGLNWVFSLAANDDLLFSGSILETVVKIWRPLGDRYTLVGELRGHSGAVMSLLAVDGGIVFSGSRDGMVKAWKPGTGPLALKSMEGHTGAVESLVMHAGYLYSGSADGTVRKWNEYGVCVAVLDGHSDTVKVLAADALYLYSGSYDGTIKAWQPVTGAVGTQAGADMACKTTLLSYEGPVEAMAVDAERRLLYSAGRDSGIGVWNTATMSPMALLRGHLGVVTTLAFDDGCLYSGSADKTIMVWKDGRCIHTLGGHSEAVRAITLHGGWLYSGADDSSIRMWDTTAGVRTLAPGIRLGRPAPSLPSLRGLRLTPAPPALPLTPPPDATWPPPPVPQPYLPLPSNPTQWKGAPLRPPSANPYAPMVPPSPSQAAAFALLTDPTANLGQLAALSGLHLHPQLSGGAPGAGLRGAGGFPPGPAPFPAISQEAWLAMGAQPGQYQPLPSGGFKPDLQQPGGPHQGTGVMGSKGGPRGARGSTAPVGACVSLRPGDGAGKGVSPGSSGLGGPLPGGVGASGAALSKQDVAACWGNNPKNVLIGSNLYGGTTAGARTGGGPLPLSTLTLPNNSGFCTTMPLPDGLGSATGVGRKKAEAEKNCVLDALEQLRMAGVIMPPSATGGKGAAVVTEDRVPPRLDILERHRVALELALHGFWNSPTPHAQRSRRPSGESLGLIDSFAGLELSSSPALSSATGDQGASAGAGASNTPLALAAASSWPPGASQSRLAALNADLQARAEARRRDPELTARLEARDRLPVSAFREDILAMVADHPMMLLIGETGCGKTTQVPQMLLEDAEARGMGAGVRVIVTQPRKVAAITVAERVAWERGESLGESVGYSVKLEMVKPQRHCGTIMFCTTGVLLRQLQSGEGLSGISHVVIDEAHERSLEIDFLLLLLKELVQGQEALALAQGHRHGLGAMRGGGGGGGDRPWVEADASPRSPPPLKIIVMSATLESLLFQQYLSGSGGACPTISVPGFMHPVHELYLDNLAAIMHADCPSAVIQALCLPPPPPPPPRADSAQDSYRPSSGAVARGLEGALAAETILDSRRVNVDVVADAALFVCYMLAGAAPGAVLVFLPSWDIISAVRGVIAERDGYWQQRALAYFQATGGVGSASIGSGGGRGGGGYAGFGWVRGGSFDQPGFDPQPPGGPLQPGRRSPSPFSAHSSSSTSLSPSSSSSSPPFPPSSTSSSFSNLSGPGFGLATSTAGSYSVPQSLAPLVPLVLVIHSSISMEEQRRVFEAAPPGTRKLILSTNIAETSVTIDDVRFVVDLGRAKEKVYHAHTDTAHMVIGWTSRAACKQRAGRAGRVGPGVCIRLFTREVMSRMEEHTTAELLRSPLEELVLQVKALGDAAADRQVAARSSTITSSSYSDIRTSLSSTFDTRDSAGSSSNNSYSNAYNGTGTGGGRFALSGGDGGGNNIESDGAVSLCAEASRKGGVQAFLRRLIQPPHAASIGKALASLQDMNALDEEEVLTPLGRVLAQLPLHPRVGKMIVYGGLLGCLDAVLALAAAIDVKDPFVAPFGFRAKADACRHRFAATCNAHASDHLVLLAAFQAFEVAERAGCANQFCEENCLSATTLRMMARVRDKFAREVAGTYLAGLIAAIGCSWGQATGQDPYSAMGLVRAVLCAALYPSVAYTDTVPGKNKAKKVVALRLLGSNMRVYAHAGSVLSERHLEDVRPNSHHVVFQEKVQTTQLFIHGCTLVPVLALVFFGGPLSLRPLNAAELRWAANASGGSISAGGQHDPVGIARLFDLVRDSPAGDIYPPSPYHGPQQSRPPSPYYPGCQLQAPYAQPALMPGVTGAPDRGSPQRGFLTPVAASFNTQGPSYDPLHLGLQGVSPFNTSGMPPSSLSSRDSMPSLSPCSSSPSSLPLAHLQRQPQQRQPMQAQQVTGDSHLVLEVGASSLSFLVHRHTGQLLVEARRALDGILEGWINCREQTPAQTQLVGCVRAMLLSYDSRGAASR